MARVVAHVVHSPLVAGFGHILSPRRDIPPSNGTTATPIWSPIMTWTTWASMIINKTGPRRAPGSIEAVFYWSFASGFLAGTIAAFSVTPFDVVKTRIQTIKHAQGEKAFTGIMDCLVQTFRNEGVVALFKGGGCRILVMAPLFGIAQTVYYLGVAERILGFPRL